MTFEEIAERNKKIIKLAKEGKTADDIADSVNLKKSRVLTILKAYRVKAAKKSHKLECDKAQAIVKELKAGTKQIEISRKLNVSRQYVNQVKNTWNIIKESH